MLFVVVTGLLFLLELVYFKIAYRFNIIDKPNLRSSHTDVTLRGGGVIFPISVLVYFLLFGFHYFWFTVGLLAISAISFADDIKHQPRILRVIIQLGAVILFFWKVHLFQQHWFWWPVALIFTIGIVNAYNFMDGINGMTTAYSFTILGSLYLLNLKLGLFDENLLICLALGNLVFAFFNFRKKATCFAGDVGSVSMAFSLLFLTTWAIIVTGNFIFILFFALYGVDTVLTILHRLYKRENIFEPHRQHLFQYLANEKKIPQLLVSLMYMLGQAIISMGVLVVWKKEPYIQFLYSGIALLVPTIIYISSKYWILRKMENLPSQV